MKGVILAGGSGSRLAPLTRITNKHLLPLYDRPMVTYAVEALVEAGFTELMLVTGGTHAGEFFRLLGNGHEYGIDRLFYAYQDKPGGIAEALGLAERFVGGDRCCVLLADNVFEQSLRPTVERFAAQERGARVVLTHVTEDDHLHHLGVAKLNGDRILGIVEKPAEPPSRYAVTGVYFYDEQVWQMLPTLEASARGELEITDVNNWYVERGEMEADVLEGFWGDAGESIEAYYEVNDFVRGRLANEVRTVIDGLRRIPLQRFDDERGWFSELARASALPKPIRQVNLSRSRQGVIRGLHYHERGQDDLFVCLAGMVRVVVLDRTTGESFSEDIGDDNPVAIYVPGIHAHGYEALTDALFAYLVTEEYDAADPDEQGISWSDPRVRHLWSTDAPILSARDAGVSEVQA